MSLVLEMTTPFLKRSSYACQFSVDRPYQHIGCPCFGFQSRLLRSLIASVEIFCGLARTLTNRVTDWSFGSIFAGLMIKVGGHLVPELV